MFLYWTSGHFLKLRSRIVIYERDNKSPYQFQIVSLPGVVARHLMLFVAPLVQCWVLCWSFRTRQHETGEMTQLAAVSTLKPMVGMVCTTWLGLCPELKLPIRQCRWPHQPGAGTGWSSFPHCPDQGWGSSPGQLSWCTDRREEMSLRGWKVTGQGSFYAFFRCSFVCFWCMSHLARQLRSPPCSRRGIRKSMRTGCPWSSLRLRGCSVQLEVLIFGWVKRSIPEKQRPEHCFGHVW